MATIEKFCVFLRAINTGGRRLTNDELLAPFVAAGFDEVAAYQAAGNVVVRADAESLRHDRLDALIAAAYGFDAPSFSLSFTRLDAVIREQPFDDLTLSATVGQTQIAFLRTAPDLAAVEAVAALVPSDDAVIVRDDVLYWLPREGISESKLPVATIEKVIGPMTIRTLGTIERLLAKFGD